MKPSCLDAPGTRLIPEHRSRMGTMAVVATTGCCDGILGRRCVGDCDVPE